MPLGPILRGSRGRIKTLMETGYGATRKTMPSVGRRMPNPAARARNYTGRGSRAINFMGKHPLIPGAMAAGIGLNAVAGYRNLPGPQRDNRNDYYLNQMRGRSSGALGQQIPRSIGGYA